MILIQSLDLELTVYKVLKRSRTRCPTEKERVFIVSVRNDVLDDIGIFMLLSGLFPEPEKEFATIRDAIGDLKQDNENASESYELVEAMKKVHGKVVEKIVRLKHR